MTRHPSGAGGAARVDQRQEVVAAQSSPLRVEVEVGRTAIRHVPQRQEVGAVLVDAHDVFDGRARKRLAHPGEKLALGDDDAGWALSSR